MSFTSFIDCNATMLYPKKRTEEKTDKRQHLMDTAEQLFSQHGYEAVSIRKLAREADVNIAMVSYYFGSKEKLFGAVIENKIRQMRRRLEALAAEPLTPWQKISQTIDVYVDRMFLNRHFNLTLMREMSLEQRPEHLNVIVGHIGLNLNIIKGFILEGQEAGTFRYADPELTIATQLGTITMVVNSPALSASLLGEKDPEIMFEEAIQVRLKTHIKALLQAHLMK
ncbi:MAG: TetR/AcrR family transcriptional regulator [Lewinellaceae bacterium]|nr:TetR/AcrR family transcriptional regulator [Lewinellaceae bacterium]